jgi:photosystem II stability/assembly factor-like uncharacterized protein
MKQFIFACIIGLMANVLAQDVEGWVWENPQPQGNRLYDVAMAGDARVWAAGTAGTLLFSNIQEAAWHARPCGTLETVYGLCFVDDTHGWGVGSNGLRMVTNDGGENWQQYNDLSLIHI